MDGWMDGFAYSKSLVQLQMERQTACKTRVQSVVKTLVQRRNTLDNSTYRDINRQLATVNGVPHVRPTYTWKRLLCLHTTETLSKKPCALTLA